MRALGMDGSRRSSLAADHLEGELSGDGALLDGD